MRRSEIKKGGNDLTDEVGAMQRATRFGVLLFLVLVPLVLGHASPKAYETGKLVSVHSPECQFQSPCLLVKYSPGRCILVTSSKSSRGTLFTSVTVKRVSTDPSGRSGMKPNFASRKTRCTSNVQWKRAEVGFLTAGKARRRRETDHHSQGEETIIGVTSLLHSLTLGLDSVAATKSTAPL